MTLSRFTVAALASICLTSALKADEKPNILFLFADDYAYDCLHAHGNERVETPHLDKLVARGTTFSQAYNSGSWSGAVCVASRTMMMTGLQVWDAGRANVGGLLAEKKLLPQRMQQAGYTTYFAGKWHVGHKNSCKNAWANTMNIRPGMPNQTQIRYNRIFTPGKENWSPTDPKFGGFWKGGKHWSEVLADDGEGFLDQAKSSDDPFFMMLCFNATHDPRQAPEKYQKKYPYDSIELPENFIELYPHEIGCNKIRDERLAPFPRTELSVKVNISEYYAVITHMDAQIGRIMEALEESGKADNTIVIFSADHGLAIGHHGLLGKQNMYEHSVRAPWIIAGPGIPKGKVMNTPIYIQDAMATCLDIADADAENVAFDSVLTLIKSGKDEKRDMYSSYIDFQRMVISGKYKLIVYPKIKVELLFDLENDAQEMKNLAENPEYKSTLKSMREKLAVQMKNMNDPIELNDASNSYKRNFKKKRSSH